MSRLELNLLGIPLIRHGKHVLTFKIRKALALLVYLAVEEGPHSREQLVALLWPDSPEGQGRASLRQTLARLTDVLGDNEHLVAQRETLCFNPKADFALDLHSLEVVYKQAKETETLHLENIEAIANLYQGDFLQGFSLSDAPDFEVWLEFKREEVRLQASFLLSRLSKVASERGEQHLGLRAAVRNVEINPLDEESCQALMRLEWQVGNPQGALETYRFLQARLKHDLQVDPTLQTQLLAQRIQVELSDESYKRRLPTPKDQIARLLDSPLVGRSNEHELLTRLYAEVARNQAQVAVTEGEAGIGKTRLVEAFLGWARSHGATVLKGKGQETGGSLAYQPVVDALRQFLDHQTDPRQLLSDTWLSELSRLLPELRDRCASLPLPLSDEAGARTRLFEAVARLLQSIATQPVVWFVDDLQWADPAMLELLQYLMARLAAGPAPVLFVLAMRPDLQLASWVNNLERSLPLTSIRLQTLKPEDTGHLVQNVQAQGHTPNRPSDVFANWLHQQTKGHPLFVVEILKNLVEQGILTSRQNHWQINLEDLQRQSGIAPGIRSVIESRFARLSSKAFELLTAGAVIAQDFDYSILCNIAGLEEQASLSAADELIRGQLWVEIQGGYAFAHDKLREVAYQVAGEARRTIFHRKTLQILEATATPAGVLAHHALALGLRQPSLKYSIKAGLEAYNQIAYQAAVVHLERAREMLIDPELSQCFDYHEQFSVHDSLRQIYYVIGRFEDNLAACEAIVELGIQNGDLQMEHHGLRQIVWHTTNVWNTHTAPNLDKTEAILRQETDAATRSGHRFLQLLTEWDWAFYEYHRGLSDAARQRLERLIEILRVTDGIPRPFLMTSLNVLARTRDGCGDWAGVVEPSREVASLCTPRDLYTLTNCYAEWAEAEVQLGFTKSGLEKVKKSLAASLELGWAAGEMMARAVMAECLLEMGELAKGYDANQEVLSKARQVKVSPPLNSLFWGSAVYAQLLIGQLDEAQQSISEGLIHDSLLPKSPFFLSVACEVGILKKDWEQACRHAKAAAAADPWMEFGRYDHYAQIPHWAEVCALLRGGEPEMAIAKLARLERQCIHENKRFRIAFLRARAVLEEWAEHTQQALGSLQEALSLSELLDLPNECWQVGGELARLGELQGDINGAKWARNQAINTVQALAEKIPDGAMQQSFLQFSRRWVAAGYL